MSPVLTSSRKWPWLWSGLLVVASGAAWWTMHHEAVALEAEAARLRARGADLAAQQAKLQRRQEQLRSELAAEKAMRAKAAAALPPGEQQRQALLQTIATLKEGAPASPAPVPRPMPPSGSHGNVYFPELFSDSHYAQVYLAWQRQQTERRFAPLFAELDLAPADRARLSELLTQKEMAYEEVDGILESQAMREGKNMDRSQAIQVKTRVNKVFDDEINEAFGEAVSARLRTFLGGTGARQDLIDRLALRLSYTRTPLDREQTGRMVALFNSSRSFGPVVVTDQFVTDAQAILHPPQVGALRELQAEIQASRSGSSVTIRRTTPAPPPPPPPRE